MTKRPLGRGLSALIATDSPLADSDEIRDIEIDLIRPGQQQPRTSFDPEKLEELAQSIRTSGIIQPLLVRPSGGMFELVAGERRWRAAQLAGMPRVPAIIREIADDKLLELALIENIQRQELNPIEEANAYKRLIESLNLTQEEVAQRVGRDRTFVTNYLRILKLPSEIQLLLESEKLTFGHARALLGLADVILQRRYAQKIVKHNWSVRETERRIKHASQETKPSAPPTTTQTDPNIRAAETKLRRHLGTQVQILPAKGGVPGRIEIEYYSALDLDRLYSMIVSARDTEDPNAISASSGR
ncbi:MAG: ParB family transcriptional regulator, chromosome partitioning protein [Blastocatellia bacterium]|jgi:ParB family chromosome partitioning protein|nr:ParB family transcriptional regulator, chromosome partitioning protein [Blastocatellia bacterium]